MHIRRNVWTKITEITEAPFEIIEGPTSGSDTDTETSPAIIIDLPGEYEGVSSPRVIQRLINELEALKS